MRETFCPKSCADEGRVLVSGAGVSAGICHSRGKCCCNDDGRGVTLAATKNEPEEFAVGTLWLFPCSWSSVQRVMSPIC